MVVVVAWPLSSHVERVDRYNVLSNQDGLIRLTKNYLAFIGGGCSCMAIIESC